MTINSIFFQVGNGSMQRNSGLKTGALITSRQSQKYNRIITDTNLNRLIRFPYPETHYCDSKVEDPTNVDLSRPLPTAQFPQSKVIPKPETRPPPPGSTGWVTQKATPKPVPSRGAWGKSTSSNIRTSPTPRSNGVPGFTTTSKAFSTPCKPLIYHNSVIH